MWANMCAKTEDNLQESFLTFYHVSLRNWTHMPSSSTASAFTWEPIAGPEPYMLYTLYCVQIIPHNSYSLKHTSYGSPVMGLSVFMKKPRHLIEDGSDSWTHFLQPKELARVTLNMLGSRSTPQDHLSSVLPSSALILVNLWPELFCKGVALSSMGAEPPLPTEPPVSSTSQTVKREKGLTRSIAQGAEVERLAAEALSGYRWGKWSVRVLLERNGRYFNCERDVRDLQEKTSWD